MIAQGGVPVRAMLSAAELPAQMAWVPVKVAVGGCETVATQVPVRLVAKHPLESETDTKE